MIVSLDCLCPLQLVSVITLKFAIGSLHTIENFSKATSNNYWILNVESCTLFTINFRLQLREKIAAQL